MLQTRTVDARTLRLHKKLTALPCVAPFSLVGDTALALQLGNRVSKKDFYDIHFLLQKMTLPEMLDLYAQKFEHTTVFHVLKSLTYFGDAEDQLDPQVFDRKVSWVKVKSSLQQAAQKIYK